MDFWKWGEAHPRQRWQILLTATAEGDNPKHSTRQPSDGRPDQDLTLEGLIRGLREGRAGLALARICRGNQVSSWNSKDVKRVVGEIVRALASDTSCGDDVARALKRTITKNGKGAKHLLSVLPAIFRTSTTQGKTWEKLFHTLLPQVKERLVETPPDGWGMQETQKQRPRIRRNLANPSRVGEG